MYRWTYGSRNNILGLGGHTSVWNTPGGTLSDKTAMKEYPCLTQEMIYEALQEGKLQGKHGSMMGNPYVKLIRHEVKAFVREKFGEESFQIEENKKKLLSVKSQLRTIPGEIRTLEEKRDRLEAEEKRLLEVLGDNAPSTKKKGSGRGRGRGRGRGSSSVGSSTKNKNETVSLDDDSGDKENESDSDGVLSSTSKRGRGSGRGGRGGSSRGKRAKLEEL